MTITSRKQALSEMEKLFGPKPVAHRIKTPHPAKRFIVGFMTSFEMYKPDFNEETAQWQFVPAGVGANWDEAIAMAKRMEQQAREMKAQEEGAK